MLIWSIKLTYGVIMVYKKIAIKFEFSISSENHDQGSFFICLEHQHLNSSQCHNGEDP